MRSQTVAARSFLAEIHLEELIRRIAAGNEGAMTELHRVTRCRVYSFVRQFVANPWNAEEVVQDVYRHIWGHASDYSRSRGELGSWLYVIARSRAMDNLRKHRKAPFTVALADVLYRSTACDPESDYRQKWRHHAVHRAVAELPGAQQELIRLAFFEGRSHTEVAKHTQLPLGTVKTRIRTALIAMRHVLTT
jgi:RNA polymerase sigma-70 factor, ECF subfamily